MLGYNGLVVIEVNALPSYEKAVEVRDQAKKMPETLMTFLGASGKSVKIVCKGELFRETPPLAPPLKGAGDTNIHLPSNLDEIDQFHINLYQTARRAFWQTAMPTMTPRPPT